MKARFLIAAIVCLGLALLVPGCSKKTEQKQEVHKAKPKSKPVEKQVKPPPGVDVFNTYDAHNKFDKHTSWAVNGGGSDYRGQAEWFVPKKSGPLNFVEIAMAGKGLVNVTVAGDKNGVPGMALETFSEIRGSRFFNGHLILISRQHPALNVGTKYWLCVEPANGNTGCSWYYNALNLSQGFAYEQSQGGWSAIQDGPNNGAFRVNVLP